jgi:hypothetical protein
MTAHNFSGSFAVFHSLFKEDNSAELTGNTMKNQDFLVLQRRYDQAVRDRHGQCATCDRELDRHGLVCTHCLWEEYGGQPAWVERAALRLLEAMHQKGAYAID